ncbi:MAG: succinylglutamate desuccinylase/aspartoacylase family protein [Myxococcales bacterium]|nr:succinylglutamate desuccinylase/aspartoacylase family protein [Myxococcales bacterium]
MRFYLAVSQIAWAIALAAPAAAQPASSRDPFHDVASLNARLRQLQAAHPTTTRIVTVATVAAGDVLALEVDPTGAFVATTPSLLVQGGIHGNEWISTEVVLRLAELTVDPDDPSWRGLTYRFIPAINVDGFAHGSRKAVDVDGTQYDANREFPVPGQPDHASRPLVAALRDYARTGRVVAVLDYHSAAECMLWPFAYSPAAAPPDRKAIAAITTAMATSVGFCSGQVAKVISYKHEGTASDWYQDALGAPAILVELGAVNEPGSQTVEQILIDQERPYRLFLDWLGARGLRPTEPPPPTVAGCTTTTVAVGAGPLGYQATGPVCDGQRHGAWTFRFAGGGVLREGTYERGREHGSWRSFHATGEPQDVGAYAAGKPEGAWKRYAVGGGLIEERTFVEGSREGELQRWLADGTLWQVRGCEHGMCVTQCKGTTGRRSCALLATTDAPAPDRHAKRSPTPRAKATKTAKATRAIKAAPTVKRTPPPKRPRRR